MKNFDCPGTHLTRALSDMALALACAILYKKTGRRKYNAFRRKMLKVLQKCHKKRAPIWCCPRDETRDALWNRAVRTDVSVEQQRQRQQRQSRVGVRAGSWTGPGLSTNCSREHTATTTMTTTTNLGIVQRTYKDQHLTKHVHIANAVTQQPYLRQSTLRK